MCAWSPENTFVLTLYLICLTYVFWILSTKGILWRLWVIPGPEPITYIDTRWYVEILFDMTINLLILWILGIEFLNPYSAETGVFPFVKNNADPDQLAADSFYLIRIHTVLYTWVKIRGYNWNDNENCEGV